MKRIKKGMTSEVASQKKKEGHKREEFRAKKIGGFVIKGNKKADVQRPSGESESVKGGNRTQWALYGIERIKSSNFDAEEKTAFCKWVNFLPENKEEYLKNPQNYSKNGQVDDLYNCFKDKPIELIKYFCGYDEIDYYVFYDKRENDKEIILNKEDFFYKIQNCGLNVYTTTGGKLSISGGPKNRLLFETELRKGKNSHRRILFVSTLRNIIDIVK